MNVRNSVETIMCAVGEISIIILTLMCFPFYYLFTKLRCLIKKG